MAKFRDPPPPLPVLELRPAPDGIMNPIVRGDGWDNERDELVSQLQDFLDALGYSPGWFGDMERGEFGESTEKAVKAFQEKITDWKGDKLDVNGQVGHLTADAINRLVVGLRYDKFETPKELTGNTLRIRATEDSLYDSVSLAPSSVNAVTITVAPEPEPWARRGESIRNSGLNVEYKEQEGNYVRWLQDGALAMYEMCEAFCRAKGFIYIIASYFSPGIKLIRTESGFNQFRDTYPQYRNILKEVSDTNDSLGVERHCIPLVSLLKTRAAENVPVRVILFHPDPAQAWLGGYAGFEDAQKLVKKIAPGVDIRMAKWGLWKGGHEAGSQHQKSAVVGLDNNKLIAFCGGVDMCYARWALPTHNMDKDPLDFKGKIDKRLEIKDQMDTIAQEFVLGEWNPVKNAYNKKGSQVLWHDLHAKLVGPIAFDLAENFCQRYEDATSSSDSAAVRHETEPYRDQSNVSSNLLSGTFPYSKQKVKAQILRSYAASDDYGIWDGYRNLFRQAKRNVYIENQYAFEDSQAIEILTENVRSNKNLKVVIVAPLRPDSYDSPILENLKRLVNCSMKKGVPSTARVAAYSLVANSTTSSKLRRVPIYVHAKIAVVDDEWVMVGSANLDRMGMGGKGSAAARGSSELCVLVHGRKHGLALRTKLAQEHLGVKGASNLRDFDAVFKAFQETARKNGRPRDNDNVQGQLVFHRLYTNIST